MADTPIKIMVFAAHPQDPFERTGGTVAKHLARGDQAMFVSLTAGVVTHAFNIFPATGDDKLHDVENVKAAKREEFERGARVLGLTDWRVLDFNESPLLVGLDEYIVLVNLIREFRPDVVLTHHPVEVGRHDHMDCGRCAIAAVDYARADGFPSPLAPHTVPNLFMFYYPDYRSEQLMATSRHSADVVVDTSSVIKQKRAAMAEFGGTQAKAKEDYDRKLDLFFERVDGAAGFPNGFTYAEAFVRWYPERVQYLPLAN
jgi:LmbE family N-acetylglucosaminyl deacetylase